MVTLDIDSLKDPISYLHYKFLMLKAGTYVDSSIFLGPHKTNHGYA